MRSCWACWAFILFIFLTACSQKTEDGKAVLDAPKAEGAVVADSAPVPVVGEVAADVKADEVARGVAAPEESAVAVEGASDEPSSKSWLLSADGPELVLEIKEVDDFKRVIVKRKGDETNTMLINAIAGFGFGEPMDMIQLEDLTFDGVKELLIPTSAGAHNNVYAIWQWQAGDGTMKKLDTIDTASGFTIRNDQKEFQTSVHVSAAEAAFFVYGYENGEIVMRRSLEIGPDDKQEGKFKRTITVYGKDKPNKVVSTHDEDDDALWNENF